MPRISTHVWETLMPRRTARIGPITAFDLLRSDGWLPILGWELSRGTTVAESDHQPGDDRDLAGWTLSRLGRSLVFGAMAARKASAGGRAVGRPRFLFAAVYFVPAPGWLLLQWERRCSPPPRRRRKASVKPA